VSVRTKDDYRDSDLTQENLNRLTQAASDIDRVAVVRLLNALGAQVVSSLRLKDLRAYHEGVLKIANCQSFDAEWWEQHKDAYAGNFTLDQIRIALNKHRVRAIAEKMNAIRGRRWRVKCP
jgi:hypothetical protein